jgi:quercetin dioxygenase-like cupin family protein
MGNAYRTDRRAESGPVAGRNSRCALAGAGCRSGFERERRRPSRAGSSRLEVYPMRRGVLVVLIAAACSPVLAQSPAAPPKRKNSGVVATTIMDRPEVRILRVEIEPGATRATHAHNDVRYHLFIPLTGTVELSIASQEPVDASPGQVYFLNAGTQHGFRNTGASPARVIEVFVRETAARAGAAADENWPAALAAALAARR